MTSEVKPLVNLFSVENCVKSREMECENEKKIMPTIVSKTLLFPSPIFKQKQQENLNKLKKIEFIFERPMDRYNIKTPTMNESFSPPLKVVRKIQRRNILKKTKIQKKTLNEFQELKPRPDAYCRVCGVSESPQWRKGPDRKISLCNACGLHYLANLQREKLIKPNLNPMPIPISFILNNEND